MKPVGNHKNSRMTMTVQELIAELSKYPPEMPVITVWEGQGSGIRAENFTISDMNASENQLSIDVENYG